MKKKSDLIKYVRQHADLSAAQAEKVADTVEQFLIEAILQDGGFHWAGFGVFALRERAGRNVRNPKTGELMAVPPSKSVTFRPFKPLKTIR